MPRAAREKSSTGIYHVIFRGINRNTVFKDEEDSDKYIKTLSRYKDKVGFKLYAYCLMGNHIHLLIKEEEEDLSVSFKRIGASYVYWYNWKYERCGNLFQDRYKSEVVEDDSYFLTVLRYIHQNPLKAEMVKSLTDYQWSSYPAYLNDCDFIDKAFVFRLFHADHVIAQQEFVKFHRQMKCENCLDADDRRKWKDADAVLFIEKNCGIENCKDLQKMEINKQVRCYKNLVDEGLSVLQISRLTGVGKWLIYKAIEDRTRSI